MPIDDTKTIWRCPDCLRDGAVEHPPNMNVLHVIDLVVHSHEDKSPLCTTPFDKLQVQLHG